MTPPASALYEWFGLNDQLFMLINGYHWPALDVFALAVTSISHPNLYPFYVATALLWSWRRPHSLPIANVVTFAIGYVFVSVIIVPILKQSLDFPRPAVALGSMMVTIVGEPDAVHTFPSGHAAFAVLLAAALAPGTTRGLRIGLLSFALLACLSRISVGAHFPADVIGGALISVTIVVLLRIAFRGMTRR